MIGVFGFWKLGEVRYEYIAFEHTSTARKVFFSIFTSADDVGEVMFSVAFVCVCVCVCVCLFVCLFVGSFVQTITQKVLQLLLCDFQGSM